ncbi:MAG: AzlD domain-containing protein [Desulfopila sp.]
MEFNSIGIWLIIATAGLGTFLIRFSFIWFLGRGKVHPTLQRLLQFVPPAVLSALIMPSFVISPQGDFSLVNDRLWAGLIAAVFAWKTKNVVLTIIVGLVSLWFFSI